MSLPFAHQPSNYSCWPSYPSRSELEQALGPVYDYSAINTCLHHDDIQALSSTVSTVPKQKGTVRFQLACQEQMCQVQHDIHERPAGREEGEVVEPFPFISSKSATAQELRFLLDSGKQNILSEAQRGMNPMLLANTEDDDDGAASTKGTISSSPPPLTWASSASEASLRGPSADSKNRGPVTVISKSDPLTPFDSAQPELEVQDRCYSPGGGHNGYSEMEMDEADRNFRAGLGWFVYSRIKRERERPGRGGSTTSSGNAPDLPPGRVWARSWLDAPRDEDLKVQQQGYEQSGIQQQQQDSTIWSLAYNDGMIHEQAWNEKTVWSWEEPELEGSGMSQMRW